VGPKARGLQAGPLLAVGDGAMGFWAAPKDRESLLAFWAFYDFPAERWQHLRTTNEGLGMSSRRKIVLSINSLSEGYRLKNWSRWRLRRS
jgi:hypothetical protein